MKKEWSGLIDQGVFDLGAVREYDAVARGSKAKGEEIHMARAHGICVEKHSQLPVGDPKRKFKGRGVLLGNQVKNQSFKIWGTFLLCLKPRVGRIFWVVMMAGMCRWPTPFRRTYRPP